MRQEIQIATICFCLVAFSSSIQAWCTSGVSYSPTNITQAVDVAVRSNSMSHLLYAQDSSRVDSTYKEYARPDSLKLKNPNTALFYALVPGFVVHGAGHFYAGKKKTAFFLLGAEIIGAGMTFVGLAVSTLPHDTDGENGSGADVVMLLGLGLFVGSWGYDVIGAHSVVKNQNDKILGKKPFPYELNLELDKGNQQIKCLVVKRF